MKKNFLNENNHGHSLFSNELLWKEDIYKEIFTPAFIFYIFSIGGMYRYINMPE
jgi:hypothetical protein